MSTERTTQSAPMGEMPSSAPLILGADKGNPVFTVYRDSERERLEVYCKGKELPSQGQWWCEHAGLLMFAAPLIRLNARVETAQPALAQWLSGLLLGAQNIEQTKFLFNADEQLARNSALTRFSSASTFSPGMPSPRLS